MQRLFAPYRAFFALPDVTAMVLTSWLARLPIGMMALSMLLFLRESLGNFQLAGSAVGAYFVAMAISAPIQGRIIDRRGPHGLLRVLGVLQPALLVALFFVVSGRHSQTIVMLTAAAAGFFQAPITVLSRTIWRHRFQTDDTRRMAFAVDSVTMELCFTIGPLIVATIIALASPGAAYLTTCAFVFGAFLVFISAPTLKYWKQEGKTERHLLGPLTDLHLVLVFLIAFGLTTGFGLLEVGYPALATSLSLPALAGVMLAINSIGSAVGGAIYGAWHPKLPVERQFAIMLALMVPSLALHYWLDNIIALGVAAFLAGATIAPSIAAQSVLVARMAPPKYATEAFTWSSTFIVSGIGAGMAMGGAIAERATAKTPFLVAAILLAVMAAIALLVRTNPVAGAKA
jgi:MFS family permease